MQPVAIQRAMAVLAAACLSVTALHAVGSSDPKEPLFVPRVVDVKIENVSLERVDVSMQMAVRASRNLTIRTLRFSDGFIDTIPVWVTPLEGRWPLRKGEEFVIPSRIAITAYARDARTAICIDTSTRSSETFSIFTSTTRGTNSGSFVVVLPPAA